jgi:hypothetical protein
MNSVWPDIAVRVLLSSTLVMAQSVLLNWLKIPFAAITLFSGIAAYGYVAGLWPITLVIVVIGTAFGLMVRPLPNDRYLLLSLAALALIRSAVGSTDRLGGQLGVSLSSSAIPVQRPFAALPYVIVLFVAALSVLLVLRYSEIGLAVDLIRAGRSDAIANTMVPGGVITGALLGFSILIAAMVGGVQGAYLGWTDPNVFRIDYAIDMLVATLVIGRMPVRGTLLAFAFFLFPDLFSLTFGYSRLAAGHIREILWGTAIIVLAAPSLTPAREPENA